MGSTPSVSYTHLLPLRLNTLPKGHRPPLPSLPPSIAEQEPLWQPSRRFLLSTAGCPSALRVKEGRQPVLPAEQVVVLEALVVLNPGGEIVGLQMAVGPARRVRIAHEGEGGQLLLELPQEVPVGGARNARVPQEVLAQEVEAGRLRPRPGLGIVGQMCIRDSPSGA